MYSFGLLKPASSTATAITADDLTLDVNNEYLPTGGNNATVDAILRGILNFTVPTSVADQASILGLGITANKFQTSVSVFDPNDYVKKAGDTMANPLLLTAAITGASPSSQASTKGYVDNQITTCVRTNANSTINGDLDIVGDLSSVTITRDDLSTTGGTQVPNLNYLAANYLASDGSIPLTGDLDLNSNDILNANTITTTNLNVDNVTATVGDLVLDAVGQITVTKNPSSALAVATKQYVDGIATGLSVRTAVRAKTTATLGSIFAPDATFIEGSVNGVIPDSFDDVTVEVGDRVLVDGEGVGTGMLLIHAGIYDVTSVGSPSTKWRLDRSSDADEEEELVTGTYTFVTEGTQFGGSSWIILANPGGGDQRDIGTDPINWVQFSSATDVDAENIGAGTGVYNNKVGNSIELRSISGTGPITTGLNGAMTEVQVGFTPASVTHNSLGGLTTGDPHTQYLRTDGSRTVTGAMLLNYTVGSIPLPNNLSSPNVAVNKQYVDNQVSSVSGNFLSLSETGTQTMAGPLNLDGNDLVNIGAGNIKMPTSAGEIGQVMKMNSGLGQLVFADVKMPPAELSTGGTIVPNRFYYLTSAGLSLSVEAGDEDGDRIEIASHLDSTAPNCTITGTGVTVNGAASYTLNTVKGRLLLTYDSANMDWVVSNMQPSQAITAAGGAITGTLTVNTPSAGLQAANKSYVDTTVANYLPLAGGTLTGELSMGTNKITNVVDPTDPQDAATMAYVDGIVGTGYVPLAGGVTITGPVVVPDPTPASDEIAHTNYVDNAISALSSSAASDYVNVTGDTVSGTLTLNGPLVSTDTVVLGNYTYPNFAVTDPSSAGQALTSDGEGTISFSSFTPQWTFTEIESSTTSSGSPAALTTFQIHSVVENSASHIRLPNPTTLSDGDRIIIVDKTITGFGIVNCTIYRSTEATETIQNQASNYTLNISEGWWELLYVSGDWRVGTHHPLKDISLPTNLTANVLTVLGGPTGVRFQAITSGAVTISGYQFPTIAGSEGQALVLNGSGNLIFDDIAPGGSGTGLTAVTVSAGGTTAMTANQHIIVNVSTALELGVPAPTADGERILITGTVDPMDLTLGVPSGVVVNGQTNTTIPLTKTFSTYYLVSRGTTWTMGLVEYANREALLTDGTRPMTGDLTLANHPTSDLHAATRRYVKRQVGNSVTVGGSPSDYDTLLEAIDDGATQIIMNANETIASLNLSGASYDNLEIEITIPKDITLTLTQLQYSDGDQRIAFNGCGSIDINSIVLAIGRGTSTDIEIRDLNIIGLTMASVNYDSRFRMNINNCTFNTPDVGYTLIGATLNNCTISNLGGTSVTVGRNTIIRGCRFYHTEQYTGTAAFLTIQTDASNILINSCIEEQIDLDTGSAPALSTRNMISFVSSTAATADEAIIISDNKFGTVIATGGTAIGNSVTFANNSIQTFFSDVPMAGLVMTGNTIDSLTLPDTMSNCIFTGNYIRSLLAIPSGGSISSCVFTGNRNGGGAFTVPSTVNCVAAGNLDISI